jgi:putative protease
MQTGRELAIDGRYILSPKDLCTIDFLDKFIKAGVRVLKIEGRARGAEYVKRVVESYDAALKAMERGEYTPELASELKKKLSTVFNRGFWEGYYAGRDVAEHTARYGSSATQRKVYIGKVTNFFKKISVAEVLVEAAPVNRGDQLLWMGETTGVLEMEAEGLVLKEQVVDHIPQGTYFSIKMPQTLRRGDKLYKMVPSEEVDQQFDNV